MAFSELLTLHAIRRLAGSRSYARGEDYFHGEQVSELKTGKGRIVATVYGTYPYRVVLRDEGDSIDYACDCPVGQNGEFCKHCVATALAWLEQEQKAGKEKGRKTGRADTGLTGKDLRAWLLLQEQETLADLLIEAAGMDERLSGTLMMKAASARGVNLVTYRKVIDQAIGIDGFIDYHGMYEYWRDAELALDGIEDLLDKGHADAAVELSEYALRRLEGAMNNAMDDGEIGMLQHRLEAMHLKACRKARPDPEALAERLFQWELTGEWGTFSGANKSYARVFGKRGTQHYRELVEAEWARIKPLTPGHQDRNYDGKRYTITRMMENLAEQDGDVEALVAIKQKNLSSGHGFLAIAELYRKARQGDKALEWAEQGIKAFGDKAGSGLQDFLADLYHRRKRHADAMALIWPQFVQNPCLETYQHLKRHADRGKRWPEWRDRALRQLRAAIAAETRRNAHARWRDAPLKDHSRLVEIFLWEKDIDAAWQAATQGGCDQRLWIRLAGLREDKHPRDAIAVYQQLIGPIVNRTNNDAYAEAAGLLRRIKQLMGKLGEGRDFRRYLTQIRVEYKRKRNFMKLLDRLG